MPAVDQKINTLKPIVWEQMLISDRSGQLLSTISEENYYGYFPLFSHYEIQIVITN